MSPETNSIQSKLQHKTWTRGDYFISTDSSLIPVEQFNSILGSDEVYWAKSMPGEALEQTLKNSLCFGLYQKSETGTPGFIGVGRCVTDFATFLFLTDVFVYSEYQGTGLGTWLIKCIQEVVESMPYLRRSLLFTGDWERSVPFYEKLMGMHVMESRRRQPGEVGERLAVMTKICPGNPHYKS